MRRHQILPKSADNKQGQILKIRRIAFLWHNSPEMPENLTSTSRGQIGKIGEAAAQNLLERRGYRIVDVNVRFGRTGELDIVAWDGVVLCFIEVKTRRGRAGTVAPAEAVTLAKQRQITQLALRYAQQNGFFTDDAEIPMRFDVVAVTLDAQGYVVRADVIQGAFFASEND